MPSTWSPVAPVRRRTVAASCLPLVAALAVLTVLAGCAGRTDSGAGVSVGATTRSDAVVDSTPLFATTTAPPTTLLPTTASSATPTSDPAGPDGDVTARPNNSQATSRPPTSSPTTDTAAAATTTGTTAPSQTVPTSRTIAPDAAPRVDPAVCPPRGSQIWEVRPPSDLPSPPLTGEWRAATVGTSALGGEIIALVRPVDSPRRRVLVIGGLHGNEPVSPPTVRGLVAADHPADVEVWLVPEANPDGVAAGTRCNANGVDLNRNFDWTWRADDGGPGPMSEPETQTLVRLVEGLQPDVVVWVHQPYGYVSSIGPTPDALEQAWSLGAGLRVRPGTTQHGGGESWTAFVAGRPSMLIEIESWAATPAIVATHRAGYEAMLDALG